MGQLSVNCFATMQPPTVVQHVALTGIQFDSQLSLLHSPLQLFSPFIPAMKKIEVFFVSIFLMYFREVVDHPLSGFRRQSS